VIGGSKCIQKSDIEKSVDHNAVKEESFEMRGEDIEANNGRDQAFLELRRSIDSNCVGRIIVGGLGKEISAKRRNGRSARIDS
jgi:hypothetical protein